MMNPRHGQSLEVYDQCNMKPTLVATLCLHSRLRRMVEHRLGVGRTVLVIDSAMNSVRLDSMPRPILQGQFWPNRTLKCAKTYVTRWTRQLEKGHFSLCPGTSINSQKKIPDILVFHLIRFEIFPQRFSYRKYPTHMFIQDHAVIRPLEYRVQGAVKDYNTITLSESSPAAQLLSVCCNYEKVLAAEH